MCDNGCSRPGEHRPVFATALGGFGRLDLMRIALACLVVVVLGSPVSAEPASRAQAVVDALSVDAVTANKLIDLIAHHDLELDRLQHERAALERRLVTAHRLDPKSVDRLLDDTVANQRAIAQVEERLLARVRQVVPAHQAARLLTLLAVTEPSSDDTAPVTIAVTPRLPVARAPESLPATGAPARPACDPFASMHGCRY